MNFDDAIAAHITWKVRLSQFIEGTRGDSISSAEVEQDNRCDLGKWIHGEGAAFMAAPHYRDLVEKHANFHKCAAEVVRKVENGDKDGAKLALRGLAGVSRETVEAIMELRKDAEKL